MPTTQALTASETAAASAGRPVLIGHNVLEDPADERWSSARGSFGAAAATADGDVRAAWDRFGDPFTRAAQGSTPNVWTLAWDVGVNSKVVDAVAIIGLDLQDAIVSLADDVDVTLDTADDNTFTTGLTNVASWTVTAGDAERLGSLFATAYVGQRYWRLEFARASAAAWPSGYTPAVGEVFLGKRRAMPFPPQRPWDVDAIETLGEELDMPGGRAVMVATARGRGVWRSRWLLRQDAAGVEARDVLRAWWRDTRYGKPFIWYPTPAAAPDRVHLCRLAEPSLEIPETYVQVQSADLTMVEQPPFYRAEIDDALVGV